MQQISVTEAVIILAPEVVYIKLGCLYLGLSHRPVSRQLKGQGIAYKATDDCDASCGHEKLGDNHHKK